MEDRLSLEMRCSQWWTCSGQRLVWIMVATLLSVTHTQKIPLPNFDDMRAHYPGYFHHGGAYRNHQLLRLIGITESNDLLLHDTSALRLSYSLNQIGNVHSLGKELIRLSRFGHDSVQGTQGLQYIFLPISYGPYLADKYGYPNITKLHELNPVQTEHTFWGKQGIVRIITYTKHGNQPKGHVALWDCNHFHQSKDWISGNTLLTVEFWESPDSTCPEYALNPAPSFPVIPERPVQSAQSKPSFQNMESQSKPSFQNMESQSKLLNVLKDNDIASRITRIKHLKHLLVPTNARHSSTKFRKIA